MKKSLVVLTVAAIAIFACATAYAGNRVEWFSTAAPTNNHEIRIGANPVNPQTVKSLEQTRLVVPGREVFFTDQRLFVNDMQQHGGRLVAGWVPAGKAILMEKIAETNEYVEYRSIFVGECGNGTRQIHRREYFVKAAQWNQHRNQRVAPPQQQLTIAHYPVYRVVQPQRTIWPADVWVPGPFGPQRLSGYTVGPNPNRGLFVPNVWQ